MVKVTNKSNEINVEDSINANIVSQDINPEVVVVEVAEVSAIDGLLGVYNSLSYRVAEIERHFHSSESAFGKAITPTATHFGDRVGVGILPYQLDAGNNDWGAWVQLLGEDDTPARAGMAYFDPHSYLITATERISVYFIQFGRGDNSANIISSGMYTDTMYIAPTPKAGGELSIQTGRAPDSSKIWARCHAPGENTATIDFYLGIHEYEG